MSGGLGVIGCMAWGCVGWMECMGVCVGWSDGCLSCVE